MSHLLNLSILIIDDEQRVREELNEFFTSMEIIVFEAEKPTVAYNILNQEHIDIVILDLRLPEEDGLTVLKKIKEKYNDLEVIMITGHGDMKTVIEAMRLGAVDFFSKPFGLSDIYAAIERTKKVIELKNNLTKTEQNLEILKKELNEGYKLQFIAESPKMKDVMSLMMKVAASENTTVFIKGETGSGKELVARGIHNLSRRKSNNFFAVNCSAIPESLFESEFFGHKKGAFTDAREDKQGWFEIANNGTLFLDEIGDMPINLQSKLLRVLEERRITRLGDKISIPVDVRIIAATNQPIENNPKFRKDLYFRLNTFQIEIPPLRYRKEDILPLTHFYIGFFSSEMKKNITGIEESALNLLENYNFPGNIRELRNIIEHAVILCDTKILSLTHFTMFNTTKNNVEQFNNNEIYDLEKIEQYTILRALQKTNQNKQQAAKLLNITWQSLDRRLKKFDMK